MTSNDIQIAPPDPSMGSKTDDLDTIADFMDNILNNMKEHVEKLHKKNPLDEKNPKMFPFLLPRRSAENKRSDHETVKLQQPKEMIKPQIISYDIKPINEHSLFNSKIKNDKIEAIRPSSNVPRKQLSSASNKKKIFPQATASEKTTTSKKKFLNNDVNAPFKRTVKPAFEINNNVKQVREKLLESLSAPSPLTKNPNPSLIKSKKSTNKTSELATVDKIKVFNEKFKTKLNNVQQDVYQSSNNTDNFKDFNKLKFKELQDSDKIKNLNEQLRTRVQTVHKEMIKSGIQVTELNEKLKTRFGGNNKIDRRPASFQEVRSNHQNEQKKESLIANKSLTNRPTTSAGMRSRRTKPENQKQDIRVIEIKKQVQDMKIVDSKKAYVTKFSSTPSHLPITPVKSIENQTDPTHFDREQQYTPPKKLTKVEQYSQHHFDITTSPTITKNQVNDDDKEKTDQKIVDKSEIKTKNKQKYLINPHENLLEKNQQDTNQQKTQHAENVSKQLVPLQSQMNQNNKNVSNKFQSIKPIIKSQYVVNKFLKTSISKLSEKSSSLFHQSTLYSKKPSVLTTTEIIQDYVNLVNKAKRDRKTFTVCGNYFSIRRAFAERGWVEKVRVNVTEDRDNWKKIEMLSNIELVEGIRDREHSDKYRRAFISKLLAGHQVDFYWDYLTNPFTINSDKVKRTIINRYPFGATRCYTSKSGLCESLKDAHWYCIENYANILYPRTYSLVNDDDIKAFIDDFRITAAISLLQWIANNSDNVHKIISSIGNIPTSIFNFASMQCHNKIKQYEHRDIDENILPAKDYEWDVFLDKFYRIVHHNAVFKNTDKITATLMIDQSKFVISKMKKYAPQMNIDGFMNLWMLKPHNGSRGSGIVICRTLKYIFDILNARKDAKYVIQKYIERPLLIHKTKFDIRQWFLVTSMPHLSIWLYRECYLRFSSQIYNLSKLDESIHLTNNSIQCRYKNNNQRNSELPEQNMWHSDTFRKYLTEIGKPYVWKNVIYKGMKETIIALFMICQEKLLTRINSFELCGADFMLNDEFRPYLIEINSKPALYPSTRITAKMCPQVLEDVVKVTVDYARDPHAATGNFELIYRDTFNYSVPRSANSLYVEGISYFDKYAISKNLPEFRQELVNTPELNFTENTSNTLKKILDIDAGKVRKDIRNTLEKILTMVHTEKDKRDDKSNRDERNKQFRTMLDEFVNIISTIRSNKTLTNKDNYNT